MHEQVKALGGLRIIATERHESRRIDNQLRGRSGRQGDPGSSRFYLSLDDALMRIFAGDRVKAIMDRLKMPEGEAIYHPWMNKALEKAQQKVEARNFEIRKNLLKFDDVMNDQRKVIYEQRREISQQFAVQQHGAETVKTAFDWGVQRCDEDPYFNARVRASKDPVGLVVQEYQQQQLLAEMTPSEVEAFRAWKASQAAAVDAAPAAAPAPASAPAAPPPPPAAPRPSLAAAPSAAAAATAIPRDGEAAFDAMFGRP